jgi:hypothetical protein
MIIFFLFIVSFFLALVHFIIYEAIVSIFFLSPAWSLTLGVVLAILCFSFVLASALTFNFNNFFTRIFYTVSASWLGCAFFLFLVSCAYIFTLSILPTTDVYFLKNLAILCFALAVIISIYGLVHARAIFIKNIKITLPNLPAEWQGRKAVWISDTHLGAVNGKNFAKEIVIKINEINPDIVFIGGDLYDGVKVDESEIIEPFAGLHPKLGTYFVTGNHEEFRSDRHYLESIKNIGIHILNNKMVIIDGLQLVGVDDKDSVKAVKFQNILSNLNIDKNKPTILLKHQPSQLAEAAEAGISLQISGHTHKAQVFPLNILTHLIFKGYDYGLRMYGQMAVYTSSGVGTWGPPLRVLSDGEIVVFDFR